MRAQRPMAKSIGCCILMDIRVCFVVVLYFIVHLWCRILFILVIEGKCCVQYSFLNVQSQQIWSNFSFSTANLWPFNFLL